MAAAKAIRILIVEDDFLVSEMIQGALERGGYTVVGRAVDGLHAVEMAQTLRPDVVLMDLELPGATDGIEAAQRIQMTWPTPIVVLTAYETPELVERASAAGVGAYLTKPPNVRDMERAITISMARFDDLLHLRRLNAELQVEIAERKQAEEARTRLTQELMTLYDTSLEVNAQSDLTALLRIIVERAADLLGARMSELYLAQQGGRVIDLAISHNLPGGVAPPGQDLARRIAVTGQAVLLDDYRVREGRALRDATSPFRRVMGVPLKVGGKVVGVIVLADDQRTDPFSTHEFWLASLFADQAAIAIENARLLDETRRRAEQMTILSQVGLAVTSGLDMEHVLQTLYEQCKQVIPIDVFYVALYDEKTGLIHFPGYHETGGRRQVDPYNVKGSPSLTTYVIQSRQTLYLPDTFDEASLPAPSRRTGGTPARSYIGVPLILRGQVIGVLSVQSYQPNAYGPDDVRLMETIATQAAIAIENARLYQATLDERGRLQALIESSRDGIVLYSVEQRILVINAPALELLRLPDCPEDWLGRSFSDAMDTLRLHAPGAAEAMLAELRRIQKGDEPPREGEYEAPPYAIRWQNLPVRVGDAPLGRLLVLRDVTAERAAEKSRNDMTHMMVHDLRNPLSLILGTLDLLVADAADSLSPDHRQALRIAYDNTERMMGLVGSILDMTRLESGQMLLERAPIRLGDLVEGVLRLQSPLATAKELRLESDLPDALPFAWADPELLGRVLQNLVGNACKFTPSGGAVRVTAQAQECEGRRMLLVSVSDTGPGISDDIRSRLFQKFAHGSHEGHGSGLGLAFCKLAVEAHGGRIWMDSAPGHGATFTFTVPIASDL